MGNCSRCRVALCDPCLIYFAADPFCRACVGGARRARMVRVSAGIAAVMMLVTLTTGIMVAALPSHARARAAARPVRHAENCRPFDQWLVEARRDLEHGRPHNALHDTALSRRDCTYDSERDRIEALAYSAIGDKFAAIAAAARYADAEPGQRAKELMQLAQGRDLDASPATR